MAVDRRVASLATMAVALGSALGIAPAHGDPAGCPRGALTEGGSCVITLASVTSDGADGSLTGTPRGGTTPITVFADLGQYRHSSGFGAGAPDAVQQWDGIVDRIGGPNPTDPGNYGEAKGVAFAPRELNRLAAQFPPNTVVIRGTPGASDPNVFVLQSVQPVAQ